MAISRTRFAPIMAKRSRNRTEQTLAPKGRTLRSQLWFDNPENPGMTALYLERYLNFGPDRPEELRSGKPIIGIAQTGSTCRPATGTISSWPSACATASATPAASRSSSRCHPIQETGKRPTAALDRNLAYLGLVEVLYGYPLDGVVLITGCDKTTPACHDGGRDREHPGDRAVRRADAERLVEGRARRLRHHRVVGAPGTRRRHASTTRNSWTSWRASAPSVGHCNTMGTASTMNALAEALGMSLPGCAAIPRPIASAAQIAYETGVRAVEIVLGGPQAVRHPDPPGVREHHRGLLGDRRLDQCADPHQRHRAPRRRRAARSRIGRRSATTCRCWSTCSRPANISARNSTAPAACRRWCTS